MAKSDFGIRLKAIFDNATNAVIAAKLGVSEDAVGTYVRGRVPPAEKLAEITNLTNCNLHWLLTGKGEKHFRASERESGAVSERVRVIAEERARRIHADAEIDGGGGRQATLKLLTDYLLATALVEFKIVDSIRDIMSMADIERAARFGFSRPTIDERLRQMMRDEIASERPSEGVTEEKAKTIMATDKIVARIEPGESKKRRTG